MKEQGAALPERKKRAKRRPTLRALLILSVLLMASAVLRLGTDVRQAVAQQLELQSDATGRERLEPENCQPEPGVAATLKALAKREDKLRRQEEAVEARAQKIRQGERMLARRLADLETTEAELRKTLAIADGAAENDLARLTEVYESMKAKDAAGHFERMDPEFSAGLLGRMNPKAAAGILGKLDPDQAYQISAILAGRNANAPRN